MADAEKYIGLMNNSIRGLFKDALKISIKNPSLSLFIMKVILKQRKWERVRAEWESRGIHVPPFLIASITSLCNLRCKGCYAMVHNGNGGGDMPINRWRQVFDEAHEMGISIALLAGGEPFTRKEILNITKENKDIIFPIFTNGLLIDEAVAKELRSQKNVIPVISLEGYERQTDERRGSGVHARVLEVMDILRSNRIFFGTSLTVTSENLESITGKGFVEKLAAKGCKLFFYVEYTPIEKGTEGLALSCEQRVELDKALNTLRKQYPCLFIAFPGDEKRFGGCLSSGRGFVHISSSGNLEPCPFAPYSDTSLREKPLKDALNSKFLREIRESPEHLKETEGGCALYVNREWVQTLLNSKKMQETGENNKECACSEDLEQ